MSFPKYPKYKKSGVAWLGKIPAHWRIVPLGRVTLNRCDGPFGSGLKSEHYSDSGVRVVRLQNIRSDGFSGADEAFIDIDYYRNELNGHDVVEDDLLIAGLGDHNNVVGRACVAPVGIEPAMVKADCFRFRLDVSQVFPAFAAAQLSAGAAADAGLLSSGSTRSRIPLSTTTTRKLTLPPIHEQIAIAMFVRRETAKINALMQEQQRLIELLKEKRQAVISHAVTKGLNPHASMKPSGLEWLGDMPEHWQVIPLKRDLEFLTSGSRGWAENYSDEGELFIRIANLTRDSIGLDLSDVQRVVVRDDAEGLRTRIRTGDVLFSITAYLGSAAVVPAELESAYVSQHVALARLRQSRLTPKWVGYVALSVVGKTWFETQSYGGTKIQLSLDDVRDLPIPVPLVVEQHEITAFIEEEHAAFNALIDQAQRAINLLQERRSALISAAVTGKIDVRGVVETEAA
jgi:type I restriction enzyme, S subunit